MIVTFAAGTTAPVASVTIPTILPVETVVWAKATEERNSAETAIKASTINRALRWEELNFDIVDLPFGIVLI
jgi:hypothetical protein